MFSAKIEACADSICITANDHKSLVHPGLGTPWAIPIVSILPPGWQIGTEVNVETELLVGPRTIYGDMFRVAVLGHMSNADWKRVEVIHGDMPTSAAGLAQIIETMIQMVEQQLGEAPHVGKFWVVIRSGAGAKGTSSFPGVALVGADFSDRTTKSLYRSVAHEVLHQWIPGPHTHARAGDWLREALPSFLSEQLLLRCGVITVIDVEQESERRQRLARQICTPLDQAHSRSYFQWHYAAVTQGLSALTVLADGKPERIWQVARDLRSNL